MASFFWTKENTCSLKITFCLITAEQQGAEQHQERGKERTNRWTLNQNIISFKDSFMLPVGTLIRKMHTYTLSCVGSHSVCNASKRRTFNQESTKGRCALLFHLLRSSLWCDLCLGPFNLHPAENNQEALDILQPFQEGDPDRHAVNISCRRRPSARPERGITRKTVWWFNQTVVNQLEETAALHRTENTLSLLSLGSHSSEKV